MSAGAVFRGVDESDPPWIEYVGASGRIVAAVAAVGVLPERVPLTGTSASTSSSQVTTPNFGRCCSAARRRAPPQPRVDRAGRGAAASVRPGKATVPQISQIAVVAARNVTTIVHITR